MKLTDNTILITGGASGIGRGLAEALHKRGNQVIIAGRRKANLTDVANANPGMRWVELNIEDPAGISMVARKLIADYPKLNVLINNAGIMQVDDVSGPVDDKLIVSTITTNLIGPIRLTGALIEHLKKQNHAAVINNSSVLGFVPLSSRGRLFLDQGGNSFLHAVSSLQAQGYIRQGDRSATALGADGLAKQQQ